MVERKRQPSRKRAAGRAGAREVHTPVGRLAAAREDRVFEAEAALGVGGAVTVMEGNKIL